MIYLKMNILEIDHWSVFKKFLLAVQEDKAITNPIILLYRKYFFDMKPVNIPTMKEYIKFKTFTVFDC